MPRNCAFYDMLLVSEELEGLWSNSSSPCWLTTMAAAIVECAFESIPDAEARS